MTKFHPTGYFLVRSSIATLSRNAEEVLTRIFSSFPLGVDLRKYTVVERSRYDGSKLDRSILRFFQVASEESSLERKRSGSRLRASRESCLPFLRSSNGWRPFYFSSSSSTSKGVWLHINYLPSDLQRELPSVWCLLARRRPEVDKVESCYRDTYARRGESSSHSACWDHDDDDDDMFDSKDDKLNLRLDCTSRSPRIFLNALHQSTKRPKRMRIS